MLFVRDFLTDQQITRSDRAPQTPLVSVILPTYARYQTGQLQRAVESVLKQTFTDFELLIIDDGSRDGSREFIAQYCRLDPRVVHIRHERNCGLPALRVNEGIELARGQYIAFQFDDDTWRPYALATLIAGAKRHGESTVIVGTVKLHGAGEGQLLPNSPVSLTTIYHENRIANNSVLVLREVFTRLGMYDCHLAMRRLTDWDLWLRLIKYVPFHVISEEIGDVYAGSADAIGTMVPYELSVFRYIHDIPRARLLAPELWREYAVDTLRIGDVELPATLARRVYQDHVVPFYLKFRHHFPQIEGFRATTPGAIRNALFTRLHHDVSEEVSFHHYDALANRRQSYKVHFQVVTQLSDSWQHEADLLMLVRVVEPRGLDLLQTAISANRPVAYYLDDDLLTFGDYGPQFAYLAPGTPDYRAIVEILQGVDAVWVTNEFIAESVRPHNQRLIPHLGCTPPEWLPTHLPRRDQQRPMKIGYVGTNYRIDEFTLLWDALRQIAREFSERVTFEFWGLDISTLPPLDAPVKQVPFTPSYFEYLQRLQSHQFDILLVPLLDHPRPRLGKSLIKYYETAVAGALGIFSDVSQYRPLLGGQTCLKAKNTVADWQTVLRQALTMPATEFDALRTACIQHVRENYTSEAQIDTYEAAWRATEFHAHTRKHRHTDGRPRIAYVIHSAHMAGGELQLWRRLGMVRAYGVEPIVVLPAVVQGLPEAARIRESMEKQGIQLAFVHYTCFTAPLAPEEFTSAEELKSVTEFLEQARPALVHSVTFVPSFGQACQRLQIPHVCSLYAIEDEFVWTRQSSEYRHCALNQSDSIRYARQWASLLGSEWFCAREVVPQEFFHLGFTRSLQWNEFAPETELKNPPRIVLTGTLQQRKRQAEAITAVGRLRREGIPCQLDLYGYTHFYPEYHHQCLSLIEQFQLGDTVAFQGFHSDIASVLQNADMLLSPSTFESFPSAIKEAMAAGVLVIATPVGGISELIIDEQTGILCADTSVEALIDGIRRASRLSRTEYRRIVEAARRVAHAELHPNRAANDLFAMYLRTLEIMAETTTSAVQRTHAVETSVPVEGPRWAEVVETVGSHPLGYEPVIGTLRYRLAPQRVRWKGIQVLMCTPLASVTGELAYRICLENGVEVRKGIIPFTVTQEPHWVRIGFPAIEHALRQSFTLALWLNEPQHTKVGLMECQHTRSRMRRAARVVGLSPAKETLYSQLVYSK